MVTLALIYFVDVLALLRGAAGLILIVGVLATLVVTWGPEVARPEYKQKAQRVTLLGHAKPNIFVYASIIRLQWV